MRIEIKINKEPPKTTAQQKRLIIGKGKRPIGFDTANTKYAKVWFRMNLRQFVPNKPLDCPLALHVVWAFGLNKSDKQDMVLHDTKPDTDNLNKMLKDIMQELSFFVNDSRVCHETCVKIRSKNPSLTIILSTEIPNF